jgi:hypothetical protein
MIFPMFYRYIKAILNPSSFTWLSESMNCSNQDNLQLCGPNIASSAIYCCTIWKGKFSDDLQECLALVGDVHAIGAEQRLELCYHHVYTSLANKQNSLFHVWTLASFVCLWENLIRNIPLLTHYRPNFQN